MIVGRRPVGLAGRVNVDLPAQRMGEKIPPGHSARVKSVAESVCAYARASPRARNPFARRAARPLMRESDFAGVIDREH
jgi:hypothetical protein